ncbi:unnamed protein product [Hymenolepis diminuta]|uniref:carnosine N-methyltransferase n=1 Tax=Hymenolepis diminuta TaxID=6216 RepID=A0A564ZAF8_HYMDI|nr:unnamed protein product [Hymenolepis diminuta]
MDDLERKHFLKTLAVFRCYKNYALNKVKKQILIYDQLSENHKALIPDFLSSLSKIRQCIEHNNNFINCILANSKAEIFDGENPLSDQNEAVENVLKGDGSVKTRFSITNVDVDKINSVLKQFVRDWSSLGEMERKQSYDPVVNEIKQLFLSSDKKPSDIKILVPGAGLGRLAWELANTGFSCQGNEWSLYMLLPAYFILNVCSEPNTYTLHPFITQFCNNLTCDNQMTAVTVPDVSPADIPSDVQFSMVAGDFVEVYTEPGPLLYHFADIPGEDSIELSYEHLKKAIKLRGFDLIKEELNIHSSFTQDPTSMLHYHYKCVFNVFRKPLPKST